MSHPSPLLFMSCLLALLIIAKSEMPHSTRGVIVSRCANGEPNDIRIVPDISFPCPKKSRTYDEAQSAETLDGLGRAHVVSAFQKLQSCVRF